MIRTYQLKHQANKSKQTEIKAILDEYRVLASKIAVRQWHLFFTKGGFNKNADIKTISTGLSERYKQTCQYQVVGSLESFISNRKNDFVDRVCHSSLDERTKIDLLYINKHGKWFNDSIKIPVFGDKGKPVYIPVQSNEYFESVPGQLKNFCQFNLTDIGEITVSFIKDKSKPDSYIPLTPKIALDLGLKNIFTTNKGDIFGRKFYETLSKYDKIITNLARNRQKQGLKVRSPRYDRLVAKLQVKPTSLPVWQGSYNR